MKLPIEQLLAKTLPARLHRGLLLLANRALRLWRRATARRPLGCAMIIHDDQGRVLLVRHSYIEPDTWMLPTGRIGGREGPLDAAAREVREEARIDGLDIGMVEFEDTRYWGIEHRNYIVGGRSNTVPVPDGREIIAAEFFNPAALPEDTSLPTVERVKRWRYRRSLPIEVPAFVRPDYVASSRFSRRRRPPWR